MIAFQMNTYDLGLDSHGKALEPSPSAQGLR